MPTAETRTVAVLILADDPFAAALLGLLVELVQCVPVFPDVDEPPEQALARVRPLAVVVLDGTLAAAESDVFFAAAARSRVGLAIFGTQASASTSARRAGIRGVPYCQLPTTLVNLDSLLREARESRWWARRTERRQPALPASAHVGSDGALLYVDGDGRHWRVYDRRGGERRQSTIHRMFVSDDGEVRSSKLDAVEAEERSSSGLAAQLARAQPA